MSASEKRHEFGLIALIASCSALGPMANNMLMPALPEIQREFTANQPAAQTTISFFLWSFAIGILFAGPLSDRYGRRPIIAGGLAIFILGSVLAALAPTLEWLVAGRVVQAIGASAGLTVARAVAGDRYQGATLAQALAIVTMTMMLGTTVSPAIGGYLAKWFSWHTGIWLMAALAIIVLGCVLTLLPETRHASARSGSATKLAREAGLVLKNPKFVGYALQVGLIYSIFLAFISVTPYVMADVMHSSATDFGLYYMLLSAGYFVGNLYVATLGRGIAAEKLMFAGIGFQMAGAALGLALAMGHVWTPMALFLPQLPLAFGQGLALPHLTARAVHLAPDHPGVASSVIGFSQQAMAGLSVQAMGLAATDTPLPITTFCLVASAVAMGALLLLTPRQSR